MTAGLWVLDGHTPIQIDDLEVWSKSFQPGSRRVAATNLPDHVRVSTVFLGVDHQWQYDGPPLIFETMIFGGSEDGYCERYSTWDEAEAGHALAVTLATAQT